MATPNGDAALADAAGDSEITIKQEIQHTEDYQKLIDYGIDKRVATDLDKIYTSGKITDLPV